MFGYFLITPRRSREFGPVTSWSALWSQGNVLAGDLIQVGTATLAKHPFLLAKCLGMEVPVCFDNLTT